MNCPVLLASGHAWSDDFSAPVSTLLGAGRTLSMHGEDFIRRVGLKRFPLWAEKTLNELLGVQASAVIGEPHAVDGEGVRAVVEAVFGATLHATTAMTMLKSQFSSDQNFHPMRVVQDLPRNAMRQAQKNLRWAHHCSCIFKVS